MRKKLILTLAAATLLSPLTCLPARADVNPPKPVRGGDYWLRNEHTWVEWEVNAAELPGRLTPQWPADFQEPGALLNMDWRIERWPVVRKFSKGERLKALPDVGGGVIMKDLDGSSWLRVQLEDGQLCFVRANARYVKPAADVTARQTARLVQRAQADLVKSFAPPIEAPTMEEASEEQP